MEGESNGGTRLRTESLVVPIVVSSIEALAHQLASFSAPGLREQMKATGLPLCVRLIIPIDALPKAELAAIDNMLFAFFVCGSYTFLTREGEELVAVRQPGVSYVISAQYACRDDLCAIDAETGVASARGIRVPAADQTKAHRDSFGARLFLSECSLCPFVCNQTSGTVGILPPYYYKAKIEKCGAHDVNVSAGGASNFSPPSLLMCCKVEVRLDEEALATMQLFVSILDMHDGYLPSVFLPALQFFSGDQAMLRQSLWSDVEKLDAGAGISHCHARIVSSVGTAAGSAEQEWEVPWRDLHSLLECVALTAQVDEEASHAGPRAGGYVPRNHLNVREVSAYPPHWPECRCSCLPSHDKLCKCTYRSNADNTLAERFFLLLRCHLPQTCVRFCGGCGLGNQSSSCVWSERALRDAATVLWRVVRWCSCLLWNAVPYLSPAADTLPDLRRHGSLPGLSHTYTTPMELLRCTLIQREMADAMEYLLESAECGTSDREKCVLSVDPIKLLEGIQGIQDSLLRQSCCTVYGLYCSLSSWRMGRHGVEPPSTVPHYSAVDVMRAAVALYVRCACGYTSLGLRGRPSVFNDGLDDCTNHLYACTRAALAALFPQSGSLLAVVHRFPVVYTGAGRNRAAEAYALLSGVPYLVLSCAELGVRACVSPETCGLPRSAKEAFTRSMRKAARDLVKRRQQVAASLATTGASGASGNSSAVERVPLLLVVEDLHALCVQGGSADEMELPRFVLEFLQWGQVTEVERMEPGIAVLCTSRVSKLKGLSAFYFHCSPAALRSEQRLRINQNYPSPKHDLAELANLIRLEAAHLCQLLTTSAASLCVRSECTLRVALEQHLCETLSAVAHDVRMGFARNSEQCVDVTSHRLFTFAHITEYYVVSGVGAAPLASSMLKEKEGGVEVLVSLQEKQFLCGILAATHTLLCTSDCCKASKCLQNRHCSSFCAQRLDQFMSLCYTSFFAGSGDGVPPLLPSQRDSLKSWVIRQTLGSHTMFFPGITTAPHDPTAYSRIPSQVGHHTTDFASSPLLSKRSRNSVSEAANVVGLLLMVGISRVSYSPPYIHATSMMQVPIVIGGGNDIGWFARCLTEPDVGRGMGGARVQNAHHVSVELLPCLEIASPDLLKAFVEHRLRPRMEVDGEDIILLLHEVSYLPPGSLTVLRQLMNCGVELCSRTSRGVGRSRRSQLRLVATCDATQVSTLFTWPWHMEDPDLFFFPLWMGKVSSADLGRGTRCSAQPPPLHNEMQEEALVAPQLLRAGTRERDVAGTESFAADQGQATCSPEAPLPCHASPCDELYVAIQGSLHQHPSLLGSVLNSIPSMALLATIVHPLTTTDGEAWGWAHCLWHLFGARQVVATASKDGAGAEGSENGTFNAERGCVRGGAGRLGDAILTLILHRIAASDGGSTSTFPPQAAENPVTEEVEQLVFRSANGGASPIAKSLVLRAMWRSLAVHLVLQVLAAIFATAESCVETILYCASGDCENHCDARVCALPPAQPHAGAHGSGFGISPSTVSARVLMALLQCAPHDEVSDRLGLRVEVELPRSLRTGTLPSISDIQYRQHLFHVPHYTASTSSDNRCTITGAAASRKLSRYTILTPLAHVCYRIMRDGSMAQQEALWGCVGLQGRGVAGSVEEEMVAVEEQLAVDVLFCFLLESNHQEIDSYQPAADPGGPREKDYLPYSASHMWLLSALVHLHLRETNTPRQPIASAMPPQGLLQQLTVLLRTGAVWVLNASAWVSQLRYSNPSIVELLRSLQRSVERGRRNAITVQLGDAAHPDGEQATTREWWDRRTERGDRGAVLLHPFHTVAELLATCTLVTSASALSSPSSLTSPLSAGKLPLALCSWRHRPPFDELQRLLQLLSPTQVHLRWRTTALLFSYTTWSASDDRSDATATPGLRTCGNGSTPALPLSLLDHYLREACASPSYCCRWMIGTLYPHVVAVTSNGTLEREAGAVEASSLFLRLLLTLRRFFQERLALMDRSAVFSARRRRRLNRWCRLYAPAILQAMMTNVPLEQQRLRWWGPAVSFLLVDILRNWVDHEVRCHHQSAAATKGGKRKWQRRALPTCSLPFSHGLLAAAMGSEAQVAAVIESGLPQLLQLACVTILEEQRGGMLWNGVKAASVVWESVMASVPRHPTVPSSSTRFSSSCSRLLCTTSMGGHLTALCVALGVIHDAIKKHCPDGECGATETECELKQKMNAWMHLWGLFLGRWHHKGDGEAMARVARPDLQYGLFLLYLRHCTNGGLELPATVAELHQRCGPIDHTWWGRAPFLVDLERHIAEQSCAEMQYSALQAIVNPDFVGCASAVSTASQRPSRCHDAPQPTRGSTPSSAPVPVELLDAVRYLQQGLRSVATARADGAQLPQVVFPSSQSQPSTRIEMRSHFHSYGASFLQWWTEVVEVVLRCCPPVEKAPPSCQCTSELPDTSVGVAPHLWPVQWDRESWATIAAITLPLLQNNVPGSWVDEVMHGGGVIAVHLQDFLSSAPQEGGRSSGDKAVRGCLAMVRCTRSLLAFTHHLLNRFSPIRPNLSSHTPAAGDATFADSWLSAELDDEITEAVSYLFPHCPSCFTEFVDFTGCMALSCPSCSAGICALCLTAHGDDAHGHVLECPYNSAPGQHFSSNVEWSKMHLRVIFSRRLAALEDGCSSITLSLLQPPLSPEQTFLPPNVLRHPSVFRQHHLVIRHRAYQRLATRPFLSQRSAMAVIAEPRHGSTILPAVHLSTYMVSLEELIEAVGQLQWVMRESSGDFIHRSHASLLKFLLSLLAPHYHNICAARTEEACTLLLTDATRGLYTLQSPSLRDGAARVDLLARNDATVGGLLSQLMWDADYDATFSSSTAPATTSQAIGPMGKNNGIAQSVPRRIACWFSPVWLLSANQVLSKLLSSECPYTSAELAVASEAPGKSCDGTVQVALNTRSISPLRLLTTIHALRESFSAEAAQRVAFVLSFCLDARCLVRRQWRLASPRDIETHTLMDLTLADPQCFPLTRVANFIFTARKMLEHLQRADNACHANQHFSIASPSAVAVVGEADLDVVREPALMSTSSVDWGVVACPSEVSLEECLYTSADGNGGLMAVLVSGTDEQAMGDLGLQRVSSSGFSVAATPASPVSLPHVGYANAQYGQITLRDAVELLGLPFLRSSAREAPAAAPCRVLEASMGDLLVYDVEWLQEAVAMLQAAPVRCAAQPPSDAAGNFSVESAACLANVPVLLRHSLTQPGLRGCRVLADLPVMELPAVPSLMNVFSGLMDYIEVRVENVSHLGGHCAEPWEGRVTALLRRLPLRSRGVAEDVEVEPRYHSCKHLYDFLLIYVQYYKDIFERVRCCSEPMLTTLGEKECCAIPSFQHVPPFLLTAAQRQWQRCLVVSGAQPDDTPMILVCLYQRHLSSLLSSPYRESIAARIGEWEDGVLLAADKSPHNGDAAEVVLDASAVAAQCTLQRMNSAVLHWELRVALTMIAMVADLSVTPTTCKIRCLLEAFFPLEALRVLVHSHTCIAHIGELITRGAR